MECFGVGRAETRCSENWPPWQSASAGGPDPMFIRQYSCTEGGRRQAYWALVESYRTARGPRQRVVAWLGKLDQAGRLGVRQAAEAPRARGAPRDRAPTPPPQH